MIGIRVSEESEPPSRVGRSGGVSPLATASATDFSNSIWRLNRSRAMASMPKVANSLRRMS